MIYYGGHGTVIVGNHEHTGWYRVGVTETNLGLIAQTVDAMNLHRNIMRRERRQRDIDQRDKGLCAGFL